jgi:hypothetical protein
VSDSQWQAVVVVLDTLSANAIAERLQLEGIAARVQSDTSLLGAARQCRVLVQADDMARARRVLASAAFTDEELTQLATGEMKPEP